LAGIEPVDDPLGQDVQEQPLRPSLLGLEVLQQPRQQGRVRSLELLHSRHVRLEAMEAALQDALLALQVRVGHRRYEAPSRTETIVALWNWVRSGDDIGANSPRQYMPAIG